MKLVSAAVSNFRSVEDSGAFAIDDVTCLVGKNEAGKSAVLQALAGLYPHPAAPFAYDRERDYPRRHLARYASRHPDEPAPVVETVWIVDDAALDAARAEFGAASILGPELTIIGRYDAEPHWMLPVDEAAAFDFLIAGANLSEAEAAHARTAAREPERFVEALRTFPDGSAELVALADRVAAWPGASLLGRVRQLWKPYVPHFLYVSTYDRMAGAVQIEQLRSLDDDPPPGRHARRPLELFRDFLDFAGVTVDDILGAETHEGFNALLKSASNTITDRLLEYWSQNPFLSVEVTVGPARPGDPPPLDHGTVARARIHDRVHRVDLPFSERSAGFVWFFSFLVRFAQAGREKVPVILLLDEPGLTLHGRAQADLLRFFAEKLAPRHQVIYSAHSPFMIDPARLGSVRIVEAVPVETTPGSFETEGTKVRADLAARDPDTLFTLRAALGYELAEAVATPGRPALVVGAPSDTLYLAALSAFVVRQGGTGLGPRWTVYPVGGLGRLRPLAALTGSTGTGSTGTDSVGTDIAVLADHAMRRGDEAARAQAARLLGPDSVVLLSEIAGKPGADIEDLFEPELFVRLLVAAWDLPADAAPTPRALRKADRTTDRLVAKAEALFRDRKPPLPPFDRHRPADWLIRHPDFLDPATPGARETLARATALFARINALLPAEGA